MTEKIAIIGSYNVGFFFKGDSHPTVGETIMANEFKESYGGKGSNQAIAAASFGGDVSFLGSIGKDKYGEDALALYDTLKISKENIRIDPNESTGVSVILIDNEGNNLISVVLGANLNYAFDDFLKAEATIRSTSIVAFQLENDHDMVFPSLKKCKEWGIPTYLDPAPAIPLSDDVYQAIDIIKPNETEASQLTGIEVETPQQACEAARWLKERGVGKVVVTLGSQGAVITEGNDILHLSTPEVKAVDSTGAGDIFSGAFLTHYIKGRDLKKSVERAIVAASLSTTKLGVIESIPSLEEIHSMSQTFEPTITVLK
jgi:ribokinase